MDIVSVVSKNMYCSYMMEKIVADALAKYAESIKSRSVLVSIVLYAIALESRKHSELLEFLAKQFNLFEETNCEQFVGKPWSRIKYVLDRVSVGEEIDFKSFVETQLWIEGAVGEETYHKILIPLLIECVKVGCLNEETAKALEAVLRKLVDDEKWHEEMLMKLANIEL
ncbi:MAG: hypothetical protein QXL96_05420 [Ignisphaera sp.]